MSFFLKLHIIFILFDTLLCKLWKIEHYIQQFSFPLILGLKRYSIYNHSDQRYLGLVLCFASVFITKLFTFDVFISVLILIHLRGLFSSGLALLLGYAFSHISISFSHVIYFGLWDKGESNICHVLMC